MRTEGTGGRTTVLFCEGCDMLVHYGHSCLVPIQETPGIQMLYVFVDIQLNLSHFVDTLKRNFDSASTKIALVSPIQFVKSLQVIPNTVKSCG